MRSTWVALGVVIGIGGGGGGGGWRHQVETIVQQCLVRCHVVRRLTVNGSRRGKKKGGTRCAVKLQRVVRYYREAHPPQYPPLRQGACLLAFPSSTTKSIHARPCPLIQSSGRTWLGRPLAALGHGRGRRTIALVWKPALRGNSYPGRGLFLFLLPLLPSSCCSPSCSPQYRTPLEWLVRWYDVRDIVLVMVMLASCD